MKTQVITAVLALGITGCSRYVQVEQLPDRSNDTVYAQPIPNINITIGGDQINNSNSNSATGGSSSSTGGNSSATGGSNNNNISSGNSSATGTGGAGGAGGSASAGNSSSTSNANNSGSSNSTNTSTNSGSASNNANNSTNNSSNTSSGVYDSGNSSNTNNNSSTNNSSNSNSNNNTSSAEVDLDQDFDFNIELESDEDYFQHTKHHNSHGNCHGHSHGHGHGHRHQCVDPHQGKNFICHVYDFTGRNSLATQLAGAPHIGSFYMDRFDVTPRSWTSGFPKFPPSLSHLLENYAVRCFAKLRVTHTGTHTFTIVSDDGMRVLLNGTPVVADDGLHAPRSASATTNLTRGLYNLEVQYFQGPRFQIAAELKWSTPHNPTSRYIDTPDLQKVVRQCR
jgi:hypothetical protein